jgi:hypothetical protein
MGIENTVYKIPAQYLRQKRWTNILGISDDDRLLACWYIGPETGRLIGAYVSSKDRDTIQYYAYNIREGQLEFSCRGFLTIDELFDRLRNSPEVYCTDVMPWVIGIQKNPPGRVAGGTIVPFPGVTLPVIPMRPEKEEKFSPPRIFVARPGEPVPVGIPDFRHSLQRNGLILASYARLLRPGHYNNKHLKKIWAAYWVCARNKAFFYCGTFETEKEAASAMPDETDERNYKDCGRDIRQLEWHSPYMVHVAPELFGISRSMKPCGRPEHIATLRKAGYTADYEVPFGLTDLRNRELNEKKERTRRRILWEASRQKEKQRG